MRKKLQLAASASALISLSALFGILFLTSSGSTPDSLEMPMSIVGFVGAFVCIVLLFLSEFIIKDDGKPL